MDRWIDRMSDEDLSFVKRFVIASGSLKAMADFYGISYPTVRLRLDRLIERIKIYDSEKITSEFERMLRAQYADGKIDLATLKTLLEAHQKELEVRDDTLLPEEEPRARAQLGGRKHDCIGDSRLLGHRRMPRIHPNSTIRSISP